MTMKIQYFLFTVIVIFTCSSAQVIVPPKYEFEKVEWGDHFTKIKKQFYRKNLTESKTSDNPFAKKRDDHFQYGYTDSIHTKKIGILFTFDTKDSTLQGIFIAYMNVDAENKQEDESIRLGILDILTKHYPAEFKERSIPFLGTVRIWSLDKTSVQAHLLASMVSIILTKR